jgi:TolB-like protein
VLPFHSLVGGTRRDHFAEGITEDVIACLSRNRAVNVISGVAAALFTPSRHAPVRNGMTSGAPAAILTGTVRRDGNRVRIVAKLVDAGSDRNIRVEVYDRQVTHTIATQRAAALQIAAAVQAELLPGGPPGEGSLGDYAESGASGCRRRETGCRA